MSIPSAQCRNRSKSAPFIAPSPLFGVLFVPGILQGYRAVEYRALPRRVGIDREITDPFELNRAAGGKQSQGRFETPFDHLDRIRIELREKIRAVRPRLLRREEPVVKPHFGGNRFGGRDPVDRPLDLAAVRRIAAPGRRIEGAPQFRHIARRVGDHLLAFDEVAVAQPHFAARREAEVSLGRIHHEVGAFDVKFTGERQFPAPGGGIFRVVDRVERFHSFCREIGDGHLQRIEHGEKTRRGSVELFADAVLEQRHIGDAVELGHADGAAEAADRRGRNSTAAHSGQRGHARVVPPVDIVLLDQLEQLAFAHDRGGQVEPRELGLARTVREGVAERIEHPVVERAVNFELQRAERVGHPFERVLQRVSKIVHRVTAPFVAVPEMAGVADPVDDRVAHIDVGRGHVDLRAQHHCAVLEFTPAHPAEEIEVLFHGAAPAGGFLPGGGKVAAIVVVPLLRGEVADVGFAAADQLLRALIHFLEVIARIVEVFAEVEAEPAYVVDDRLLVFGVLLGRIGVVEAEVTEAAVLLSDTEIQADRLGVADVEIAVGLGGKAGDHPAAEQVGFLVVLDHLADEIERLVSVFNGIVHDGSGTPVIKVDCYRK